MSTAKFDLGRLMITPSALSTIDPLEIAKAISRHLQSDWGDCDPEDQAANNSALMEGSRLFSVYHTTNKTKFWIITEWDRSSTTVLLPQDY